MSIDSMKRLENFVHDQGEPGDSTMMFRRIGESGPETLTVCLDPSGHVEEVTFHVQEPDGSQVMIQGNRAIVESEGEYRYYELKGTDIVYKELLRADLFAEPAIAKDDSESKGSDLSMIKGALRTFEHVQESPEGFKKLELFEEIV
ncbi:MAG: hypothetical protein WC956_00860, partial [bacterium]